MNVEFQIHGVLANGQSFWKQDDKDYYQTFYSHQTKNSLLTVEVLKRPQGLCTYYNYLRYNNVVSRREGSYFGMSVRIDGEYCVDVRGMYDILDNLFEKKIVGNVLMPIENGNLKYTRDDFDSIGSFLAEVENNFSGMFSAFFGAGDFIPLQVPSQNRSYQINPADLSSDLVHQAISQNLKITLSPEILPMAAQDIEKRANDSVREAHAELDRERRSINDSASRYGAELSALRKEVQSLRQENAQLKMKAQQCGKDNEILEGLRKLRQQMATSAEIIQARLPETTTFPERTDQEPSEKRKSPETTFIPKNTIAIILGGIVIIGIMLWLFFGCNGPQPSPLTQITNSSNEGGIGGGYAIGSLSGNIHTNEIAELIRNLDGAEIDISPTPNQEDGIFKILQLNTTYTLSIKKHRQPVDLKSQGTWTYTVDDGVEIPISSNPDSVTITFDDYNLFGKNVTINYSLDTFTQTRQLKIQ